MATMTRDYMNKPLDRIDLIMSVDGSGRTNFLGRLKAFDLLDFNIFDDDTFSCNAAMMILTDGTMVNSFNSSEIALIEYIFK